MEMLHQHLLVIGIAIGCVLLSVGGVFIAHVRASREIAKSRPPRKSAQRRNRELASRRRGR